MNQKIDARGLSCPQPVLMTLKEINSGVSDEIRVLVDNEASKENVIRAAQEKGWLITEVAQENKHTLITINKPSNEG